MDAVRVWLIKASPAQAAPGSGIRHEWLLDDEERRRAARLAPHHRAWFRTVRVATRVIVGELLGAPPEQLRWARGRHGKPELVGAWTGLAVNLSHSRELALVAVASGREVGVDVQWLRPDLDPVRLAGRFFPAPEARFVTAGATRVERLARFGSLWARKESCVKAAGGRLAQGLSLPVQSPTGPETDPHPGLLVRHPSGALPGVYRLQDLPAPPGFRAAVAATGAGPYRISVRHWPDRL